MPSRAARLTLITLVLAGAAPAEPDAGTLIDQLADPDPAVRRTAYDTLFNLRVSPTAQLRAALKSGVPAVAESAASLLLTSRGSLWYTADDAAAVRLMLSGYGQQSVEGRAQILQSILDHRLPDAAKVVVRVASLDPSGDVAWLLFDRMQSPARPLDAGIEAAIAALDPAQRPPGLTITLARALAAREDLAALPLVRGVVESERRRQTASPQQFAGAVQLLAQVEARQGDAVAAVEQLRGLVSRPHETENGSAPVDQILSLQACRGPLPGLAKDLDTAAAGGSANGVYALGELARRAGMPVAAGALFGAASADRDEAPAEQAARLAEAADWLTTAAGVDAACRVYDRIATIDTEPTRGRVLDAYLRLADLHEQAGRFGLAGDAIQRLIARQSGQLPLNRNGVTEIWTPEDQQAKAAWYFLLDALARDDRTAATNQAGVMIRSGSTDDTLFIQALPYLSLAGNKEQIDAYFDRVFERTKARMTDNPDQAVWANDIAWLCAKSDRHLKDATGWAEYAVLAQPNEAAFIDTLAEVRFRTGRASEAAELERRALALHPPEETFMRKQLARFETAAAATQPAK